MPEPSETYLDHAASAPLLPEAREAIVQALDAGPGNASSAHTAGRRLRKLLGDAREAVAALVGARPEQVVFTSGTSESNRLAVRGLLSALGADERRLVLTDAAHDGLRSLAAALRDEGVAVATVGTSPSGHVSVDDVTRITGDAAAVVALSHVESVTGALQPVGEAARALPRARVHVDAAQSVGRVPVDLGALGAATVAFSAHKIGGPQGVGALVIRDDTELRSPDGEASQERGRRAGTEAVALAAGFGAAAAVARDALQRRAAAYEAALRPLREYVAATPSARIVTAAPAAPGMLLVHVAGCPGEALAAALDAEGVRVSTGTACASGARTPPHVLTASGWNARDAAECVRVTTGWNTSSDDVQRLVERLRIVTPRVRTALARAHGDGEKKLS
jgi:cysteine desulfurase